MGVYADAGGLVEDNADFVWPPTGGLGCSVDPLPHGGELVDRLVPEGGDPAVGEGAGDRERARPEAAQPHRDRVSGLGFHGEIADAVVVAVLGVAGARPGAADNLDGLCEAVD